MRRGNRRRRYVEYGNSIVRSRMIIAFAVVMLLFLILTFKLGWVQIIASDKYATMAKENQTTDEILSAKRGNVLDRNGSKLAVSTTSYKIWLRLQSVGSNTIDSKTMSKQLDKSTSLLSKALNKSEKKIRDQFDTDSPRIKVADSVSKDVADYIKDTAEQGGISLIEVEENTSRNYPLGSFASHVIGSVNNDNNGQSGIELEYNKYLSGVAGRWIKNTDRSGDPIPGGEEIKYEKKDGLNVVLTIDETIQYYVEKEIKKTFKDQNAKKVSCIVMDPKNGDIMAMASYPDFDLNSPTKPAEKSSLKNFNALSDKKKTKYLNAMWRNPLTSDLYEPGSVFKLVTVGSALEERTVTPQSPCYCNGFYNVAGEKISCHKTSGHGGQTVTQAVANSCNPAMMQIIQKMGNDKFYKYLELFGMTNKTGIDFPGEAAPLLQNQEDAGPVGLATMSFGHGLTITPLQMISAVSAYGNEGKLMKPRLVRELRDNNGKAVKEFGSKIIRQVVSEKTSKEMRGIMDSVISDSKDPVVDIAGYKVGAKTGTSRKIVNNQYQPGLVIGSTVCMAPIDDPQFVVLVTVDEPDGEFGSTTAGPAVEAITEETLRYLNVEPSYTDSERAKIQRKQIIVPKVSGMKYSKAVKLLGDAGLKHTVSGGSDKNKDKDFKVVDQYPKAGEYTKKGSSVFLYKE